MKLPLFLIPLCLLSAPAYAQMYKCVDARGVTHYSDSLLPYCKGKVVDIRPQEPISGKLESYGTDVRTAEQEFQRRQVERDKARREQDKADEERKRRCERLRAEHQRFISLRRVPLPNLKPGERDYLDAAERDAKTAQMEATIARECR